MALVANHRLDAEQARSKEAESSTPRVTVRGCAAIIYITVAISAANCSWWSQAAGDGSVRIHLGPDKHSGRPKMLDIRLLAVSSIWYFGDIGELLTLCESQIPLARVPFQTLPNCSNLI
jgi:hypothetical protein